MKRVVMLWLLVAGLAWSCGICDSDRKAAVYDYRMVQQAGTTGQLVVYLAIDGSVVQSRDMKTWLSTMVSGIAPHYRVSLAPAAMALELAPDRVDQATARLRKKLAPRGLRLRRLP